MAPTPGGETRLWQDDTKPEPGRSVCITMGATAQSRTSLLHLLWERAYDRRLTSGSDPDAGGRQHPEGIER
jgi:hypothetical protein